MIASKKRLILATVTVVVLAGAAWLWLGRAARTASTEAARWRGQQLQVDAETRRAQAELAAVEASLAEAERVLSPAKPAVAASVPVRAIPNTVVMESTIPELGALGLKSDRLYVKWAYDRFYRALGLTPAQIEQFEGAWLDYRQREMDLYAIGLQDEAARKTTEAMTAKLEEEYRTRLKALFGPEGYGQFREYERIGSIRNSVVRAFAGAAAYHDVPITAEQARQLTEAAVQASAAAPAARDEALLRAIDWEAFQTRARQILTPEQYDVMRNVYMPTGYRGLRQLHIDNLLQRALEADGAK